MAHAFYSTAAARRSLIYFLFGKAGAAVSGLAVLLVTLRMAPVEAFGAYVALMAATEIVYIVSGLGLSYFAQRYIPELRIRAAGEQFNRQLWSLVATRALLAIAFALPIWAATSYFGNFLGVKLSPCVAAVFAVSLVFGLIMRYIDELLQSLLLQGWAQVQSIVRNLVRLTAMAYGAFLAVAIDLRFLLVLEVCVGILAVTTGLITFARYMARTQSANLNAPSHYPLHSAWRQSIRFYLAQILAQGYGVNAMKLLVTAVVGVHGTAVLGFGQSLADLLRSYSPAFLLGGWVRPIMVSRYVEHRNESALKPITRLVVSLSIVGLLPFLVVFAVFGHQVASLFAGGKYLEAAPLLAPLVCVVCIQAVHAVFGMVCAAMERTAVVLVATAVCLTTLPISYVLTQSFGLGGTVMALVVGELLWVATVYVQLVALLGKADFADLRALSRAALMAVGFAIALVWIHRHWALGMPEWIVVATVASVLYWGLAWYGRVFAADQRALIGKLLRRETAESARA